MPTERPDLYVALSVVHSHLSEAAELPAANIGHSRMGPTPI